MYQHDILDFALNVAIYKSRKNCRNLNSHSNFCSHIALAYAIYSDFIKDKPTLIYFYYPEKLQSLLKKIIVKGRFASIFIVSPIGIKKVILIMDIGLLLIFDAICKYTLNILHSIFLSLNMW